MGGAIWNLAWMLLLIEEKVAHLPLVGKILDTLLGPAHDFHFVSKTTPVEPDLR